MDSRREPPPPPEPPAEPPGRDAASEQERAWLARLARGDPAALEAIYRRHKDDLLTVAAHLAGGRAAAEDVLHDVLVALARRAASGPLRLETSLRAYLVGSCLNRARDLRRRRASAGAEALAGLADPGDAPDAAVAREDEARRVAGLLAALPDAQREVVCLRVFGGLTLAEIAALTAASPNTVQSRWRYAARALARRLRAAAGAETRPT